VQKKYFIIALVFTVLLGFSAFLAGRASTGDSVTELESRIAKVTADNERLTKRIGTITEENNRLTIGLQTATGTINRLNGELFEITNRFSDFGQGFSDINSGLQGVIEGIDYYIKKARTEENNDNR
jgi:ABC-type uncharacterized transport system permease subunit